MPLPLFLLRLLPKRWLSKEDRFRLLTPRLGKAWVEEEFFGGADHLERGGDGWDWESILTPQVLEDVRATLPPDTEGPFTIHMIWLINARFVVRATFGVFSTVKDAQNTAMALDFQGLTPNGLRINGANCADVEISDDNGNVLLPPNRRNRISPEALYRHCADIPLTVRSLFMVRDIYGEMVQLT
jgi:hypothetical protein